LVEVADIRRFEYVKPGRGFMHHHKEEWTMKISGVFSLLAKLLVNHFFAKRGNFHGPNIFLSSLW